jgi:hypothetical protein
MFEMEPQMVEKRDTSLGDSLTKPAGRIEADSLFE